MPRPGRWVRLSGPLFGGLLMTSAAPAGDDPMQRPPWAACEYCHGEAGRIDAAQVPAIAAQSAAYIVKQLADFRAGRRASPQGQMRSATNLLDAADDAGVAAYFAAQSPRRITARTAADDHPGAGLYWSGTGGRLPCAGCHTASRQTLADGRPFLFGLNRTYLIDQLQAFRDGRRVNDPGAVMRRQARVLSDRQIRQVADYLAVPD